MKYIFHIQKYGYKRRMKGYFTVEAAMIMPFVLGCYLFVSTMMCFLYERCVLEQNACRLPVWLEYVVGFSGLYEEDRIEFTEKEYGKYILNCLDVAEKQIYLFGQDIRTDLTLRGDRFVVERGFSYTILGKWNHVNTLQMYLQNPVEYIRASKLIKENIKSEEETDD